MNLFADYDPVRRAVVVKVYGVTTDPTIIRTDPNGRTEVRRQGATHAKFGDGHYEAVDREHAHLGPVRYTVTVPGDAGTVDVSAAGLAAMPTAPVLSDPLTTTEDLAVLQVSGLTAERSTTATVHRIIGRTSPVVTHDVLGLRVGTLGLLVAGHDQARAVGAAATGRVLLLRQADHPGLDLWFTTTGATAVHEATRYWRVDLAYYEVPAPSGLSVQLRTRTWATVKSDHTTFADVASRYLTWADLLEGQKL